MTKATVPATRIGLTGSEAVSYGLFVLPSEALQDKVTKILKSLEAELPGVIWPMPSMALHFTLYDLVEPRAYSEDKEALFERHRHEYEEFIAKILSSVAPIEVNLNTIEASPYAIIIRGEDDGSFNKIRKQILEKMPISPETRRPPNIIHSSIARYLKKEDLKRVQEAAQKCSIRHTETVTEVRLLINRKFPQLDYDTIRTYRLDV